MTGDLGRQASLRVREVAAAVVGVQVGAWNDLAVRVGLPAEDERGVAGRLRRGHDVGRQRHQRAGHGRAHGRLLVGRAGAQRAHGHRDRDRHDTDARPAESPGPPAQAPAPAFEGGPVRLEGLGGHDLAQRLRQVPLGGGRHRSDSSLVR
jgi:hypothetical protein